MARRSSPIAAWCAASSASIASAPMTMRRWWRRYLASRLARPHARSRSGRIGVRQHALIARFLIRRNDVGSTNNNNQRPRLVAFCGLPGSGKTTIAKVVEKTTGAVRLNTDEWQAALGVDFFDDEFRDKLQLRLYEHGLVLLTLGQSIILEDGLWRRDERDRHREVAHKLGAAIEIHYFDVPFDELWRRLEARNAIGAHGTVPITRELLKECWRNFQRPDEAELALFDSYVVYT
jgi:predicted kinase